MLGNVPNDDTSGWQVPQAGMSTAWEIDAGSLQLGELGLQDGVMNCGRSLAKDGAGHTSIDDKKVFHDHHVCTLE